jgi:hypothetical protein
MSARLRYDVTIKAGSSVPPSQAALGLSTVTLPDGSVRETTT